MKTTTNITTGIGLDNRTQAGVRVKSNVKAGKVLTGQVPTSIPIKG